MPNYKIVVRIIFFILLLGLQGVNLSGCTGEHFLRDRAEDYKREKHYPRLKIPQGIEVSSFAEEYEIPGE